MLRGLAFSKISGTCSRRLGGGSTAHVHALVYRLAHNKGHAGSLQYTNQQLGSITCVKTFTNKDQRVCFSSKRVTDPYELLNVPRTATTKEIKLAYFREAKRWHPDLNPNDPNAKDKFQRVAAAYELLSDEQRRRVYDATGRSQEATYGGGAGDYGQRSSSQHAEDVFNSVKEDMDVIKEAFVMYTEEVKDELQYAVDCAKNQDWNGLWGVAKDHKLLILGVVVPTVVFLRYPPAVFVVLRVLWAMSNVALVGLLRSGNLTVAARTLWQMIVKLSREQHARAKSRTKRK